MDNRGPIGVEIEHGADPFHDEEERLRIAEFNPHSERVAAWVERDLKVSGAAMQRNSTPISGGFDCFDSGSGARGKKVQHGLPVIRWTEIKPEEILVSRRRRGVARESVPRKLPDLGWGSMIDLADAGVEAANAAESGS